jgi:hypothetical protein
MPPELANWLTKNDAMSIGRNNGEFAHVPRFIVHCVPDIDPLLPYFLVQSTDISNVQIRKP